MKIKIIVEKEKDIPEYCPYCGSRIEYVERWTYRCSTCETIIEVYIMDKTIVRMAGIGAIHFRLAEEAEEILRGMNKKYFKASQLFDIMKDKLPNQDIRDISKILHILKQKGKIRKWKRRTWEIVKL